MAIQEGFHGERLVVVPRPIVDSALEQPVTRRLMVTDAGYFPAAQDHRIRRVTAISEHIVIVCSSGAGWVSFRNDIHHVRAGQALVIPAKVPHEYGADSNTPWTIWWVHVTGLDAPELVSSIGVRASQPTIDIHAVERVVGLLDEIVTALERAPSQAKLIAAAGSAWKLLTQLTVDQFLPRPGDPLERAMAYLEERLESSIRVTELAALVGVSASHLSALFHQATGGGVLAHHTALRMARARHLLDTTGFTITDIAEESGYGDSFYFSRQFRKYHNMSPTEYRNRDAT
ncbi:MAG: AraC family transcriptional regulator [Cellulomonadaceae bacterium]|nr:AraC family transcriptional regulator [Cellulomonadaceae bacterium]